MGDGTYLQSSFHGGEVSKNFQGRYDRQDYRTFMARSLNGFPIETGAWVRRPGFMYLGTTRLSNAGKLVKFDFQAASPYNMEFTDAHLRFWNGPRLVATNDSVGVSAISTGNPTLVSLLSSVSWVSGDQVYFSGLGTTTPPLQARVFILVRVDATHFTLRDSFTGLPIGPLTVGFISGGVTLNRILDLVTPYAAGIWQSLRSVQTDRTAFLLQGSIPPQALTVTPHSDAFASFVLSPAVFNDGPYLDPFDNGVQATPSAKSGIINITLSFPAWDATKAYALGYFVSYSSVNYRSRVDRNVNHQPDISATQWEPISAGEAIAPGGFSGADVGRLVRLFSEPPLWNVATAYVVGNVVSYNPSGLPGQTTYWTALTAHTGKQPGLDLVNWTLTPQGAAIWSWGRITALTNAISGTLAGSTNIGDMTADGGLAAAFDGVSSKTSAAGATKNGGAVHILSSYIGKNYSGASDQKIGAVTINPSNDRGVSLFISAPGGPINSFNPHFTVNLRGKATLPVNGADGTLLGTSGLIEDTVGPISIASTDITTAWKFVWVEIVGEFMAAIAPLLYDLYVAQVQFFNPTGSGVTANGVSIEILGPPLLYTSEIRIWRLGVYSNTTGWPTAGTYQEGRLWLTGVLANRTDSSVSNGIKGGVVNFAPTDQYGTVSASSAISYTFNAPDENPIFWMMPDLKGIICGTQGGEWLLHPPTPGPLSPFNVAAQRNTNVRCANIEPRRTEHTTIFVQAFRRKTLEYFDDIYSGKFTGPSLQEASSHLTKSFIDEVAYQQELVPLIWERVAGRLIGATYKRDTPAASQRPVINGWHAHDLGSGRTVASLCVGPAPNGDIDSLSIISLDPSIGAVGSYHVEVLTEVLPEDAPLADAWYLDNAVEPSSRINSSASVPGAFFGGMTLNGLWHLNDHTVQVFAGGLDCGDRGEDGIVDFLVTDGSVFVPYGDGISRGPGRGLFTADFAYTARIVVGFTYTSDGQIVRPNGPAETGARNGPGFGKIRRSETFAVQVEGTKQFQIGTTFSAMSTALLKSDSGRALPTLSTFTGIYRDSLKDNYSLDCMLCWRQTRPMPLNVLAVGGPIMTQDT